MHHREEFRPDKGFVEPVDMQIQTFVELVVHHRFPLVAHEAVRKVRIEAKAFAGSHLDHPTEICTVHIIAQFAKGAQIHRCTGRKHWTEGFRRIGRHKKRKKEQYGKGSSHKNKDRIIYLPQNRIHEPIKDLP